MVLDSQSTYEKTFHIALAMWY